MYIYIYICTYIYTYDSQIHIHIIYHDPHELDIQLQIKLSEKHVNRTGMPATKTLRTCVSDHLLVSSTADTELPNQLKLNTTKKELDFQELC